MNKVPIRLHGGGNQKFASHLFKLGLDTEMLLNTDTRVWPHLLALPQKRDPLNWGTITADWHGDGFAFELCIAPQTCIDAVMYNTALAFSWIKAKCKIQSFEVPAIYNIPDSIYNNAPVNVQQLGCTPSFNVYADEHIDPSNLEKTTRTTGGHLHISHYNMDFDWARRAVAWADIILGTAWITLSTNTPSDEALRRQFYGRAGEHRLNIYPDGMNGFEYRVLPGTMLSNPICLSLMFSLLRAATTTAYDQEAPAQLSEQAREAINTANPKMAQDVLDALNYDTKDSMSRDVLRSFQNHKIPVLSMDDWIYKGLAMQGFVRAMPKF